MLKRYPSKKSFTYKIYAGTSKAAHKVFKLRGASSTRQFSLLQNLQFFAWEIMADSVRLQLGMHLRLGILQYNFYFPLYLLGLDFVSTVRLLPILKGLQNAISQIFVASTPETHFYIVILICG